MENFANEFVSKLDGKISDEALRTVLQELQVFTSNYDISQRETHVVPYQSNVPDCYRVYMVAKKIEGMSPESMKTYNFYLTDFLNTLTDHSNRLQQMIYGFICTKLRNEQGSAIEHWMENGLL